MKKIVLSLIILVLFISISGYVFAQETSTKESTTIDKVKEKVRSIRKNPKAFIGVITDKTQSSLQVKSEEGKIQSISVSEDVSLAKMDKSPANIKFSDIAIGDFIVALGFADNGNALTAKRILMYTKPPELTRKMTFGTIKSLSKKQIGVETKDGNTVTLNLPKKWQGPDVKDLTEGDTVIISYQTVNNQLTLRTISLLSKEVSVTPTKNP